MRRLRLLAVLVPLLLATGCGFKPEPIGSLPSFPQAVTDGIGRRVTLESQPRRVVSLDPGLTESAFAVGAGPLVVAGSGREHYPAAALRLPHAAGEGKTPSIARLRRLRPDLVLMPNGTAASAAAAVQRGVGVPVYVAGPGTISGIEHDVDQVGALTGNAAAAGALVKHMQSQLRDVKTAIGDGAPVPVFVDEGFFYTIDPSGIAARLIALAGGANVASDAVPGHAFPLAKLRAAAPQLYLAIAGRGVTLAGLRHSKATRDLPAVRHRRFSLVDDGSLTDTGPRVVSEVRDLARLLHPSLQIP
ncbi:MAG TPA: ABC transporter substrate-binding protein [Gaiellales bacterium]